jgi:TonB family protein
MLTDGGERRGLTATAAVAGRRERVRALTSSLALHAGAVAAVLFTGAVAGPPRAGLERLSIVLPVVVKTVPTREVARAPIKPLVVGKPARLRFTAPVMSRAAEAPALAPPVGEAANARRMPDIPQIRIEPEAPPAAAAVLTDTFAEAKPALPARSDATSTVTGAFDRSAAAKAPPMRGGVAAAAGTSFGTARAERTEIAHNRTVSAGGFGAAQSSAPAMAAERTGVVTGAGFGSGTMSAASPARASRPAAATAAGFGSVGATGSSAVSGSGRPGRVEQASFGDIGLAAAKSERRLPAMEQAQPLSRPLAILDKPRPAYSDEGRRLQIEGDVLIEAEFTAEGAVRVLRIVHGLGHGLDERATAAARGIRFRPAERNGRPVDTVAMVRLEFQLAF